MNANELADEAEMWGEDLLALNMKGGIPVIECAKMLRKINDDNVRLLKAYGEMAAHVEELKKEKWMTEVNVQQQTLAYIIKLLTVQHDTLACTSYPMSKENREAIKK